MFSKTDFIEHQKLGKIAINPIKKDIPKQQAFKHPKSPTIHIIGGHQEH